MNLYALFGLLCLFARGSLQGPWRTPDILTKECNETVTDLINHCKTQSFNKWFSSQLKIHRDKRSCCHIWDVIDCFEENVKEKCDQENQLLVRGYSRKISDEYDLELCRNYEFYSTKCTIGVDEINLEGSWLDMIEIVTELDDCSPECYEIAHENPQACYDRINHDYVFDDEKLNNTLMEHKFHCCVQWRLVDCFIEVAKATGECTHRDVVGLIGTYDEYKEMKSQTECSDYPYKTDQCKKENIWTL